MNTQTDRKNTVHGNNRDDLRRLAIKSIKAKKAFEYHLSIYIVFCLLFLTLDWFTGKQNALQWAWWPILGWGIGVLFNWYSVYKILPRNDRLSETEIAEEMQRLEK